MDRMGYERQTCIMFTIKKYHKNMVDLETMLHYLNCCQLQKVANASFFNFNAFVCMTFFKDLSITFVEIYCIILHRKS